MACSRSSRGERADERHERARVSREKRAPEPFGVVVSQRARAAERHRFADGRVHARAPRGRPPKLLESEAGDPLPPVFHEEGTRAVRPGKPGPWGTGQGAADNEEHAWPVGGLVLTEEHVSAV